MTHFGKIFLVIQFLFYLQTSNFFLNCQAAIYECQDIFEINLLNVGGGGGGGGGTYGFQDGVQLENETVTIALNNNAAACM